MAAPLQRLESFQYPSGHYAHLTENQQEALDAFKKICQDEGYYTPPGADKVTEASHDDETLLRYLRARRFVPLEAFKQFKDTEDWRKEHGLVDLYSTIEVEEYEQTRRLYPQWLGRRDKRGIPVFLFEVAPLNSKNIAAYEKDLVRAKTRSSKVPTKNLRLFALYESLTRFVLPLCSAIKRNHPETPISQSNNIVDISGVGLKQFWNLKGHMQDASQLATAHYPETLDRIFIIGAPSFFPTVWGWIKRWFDPITVSKIFILSPANVFPTLSQYIEPDNIPRKYGGNLDFEWGNMPVLEPEIEAALKWEAPDTQNGKNTFPIGPMRWESGEHGAMRAIAVGSENGQPRRRTIFTIPSPVRAESVGRPVVNTPIDEAELRLTSAGTDTQPPDTSDPVADDATPPSDTPTSSATPQTDVTPQNDNPSRPPSSTPAAATTDPASLRSRDGTSETRGEQSQTQAVGQLADGHGDRTVATEPGTVGQQPTTVSTEAEKPSPDGYVDQVKQVAMNATGTVASTVGNAASTVAGVAGGKTEMSDKGHSKSAGEKELDRKIDQTGNPPVEEFLRGTSRSKA